MEPSLADYKYHHNILKHLIANRTGYFEPSSRDESLLELLQTPKDRKNILFNWSFEGERFLEHVIYQDFSPETFAQAIELFVKDYVDEGSDAQNVLEHLLRYRAVNRTGQFIVSGGYDRIDIQTKALNSSEPGKFIKIIQELIPARFDFRIVTQEIEERLALMLTGKLSDSNHIWFEYEERVVKKFLRNKGLLSLEAKERYYDVLDFLVGKYGLRIFNSREQRVSIRRARFDYFFDLVHRNATFYDDAVALLNRQDITELQRVLEERELNDTQNVLDIIANEDGVENNLPRIVTSILPEETDLQFRRRM